MLRMLFQETSCPVCGGQCQPYDVVDFHKSCVEEKGIFISLSGVPIYYFLCEGCGFLFAPEFSNWSQADFGKYIYNADYINIDPDFKQVRPETNAQGLIKLFPMPHGIRHLDYGGGEGYLSRMLRGAGWNSTNYDPYAGSNQTLAPGSKFDFITSFEVFEHVPDPVSLMEGLGKILDDSGIILFSTMLSDGHIQRPNRINWWYISPRNGHISIYSKESLQRLANRFGYHCCSISEILHVFWKNAPPWARHILPQPWGDLRPEHFHQTASPAAADAFNPR